MQLNPKYLYNKSKFFLIKMVLTISKLVFYLIYSIGLSMVVWGLVKFVKAKKLTNKKSEIEDFIEKYPWTFTLISWAVMILFDLFNI